MSDPRRDVAERLETLATMNRRAYKHASALLEAAALLRSEGREPDAWVVRWKYPERDEYEPLSGEWFGTREHAQQWIDGMSEARRNAYSPIVRPVYIGTPSDSPEREE